MKRERDGMDGLRYILAYADARKRQRHPLDEQEQADLTQELAIERERRYDD